MEEIEAEDDFRAMSPNIEIHVTQTFDGPIFHDDMVDAFAYSVMAQSAYDAVVRACIVRGVCGDYSSSVKCADCHWCFGLKDDPEHGMCMAEIAFQSVRETPFEPVKLSENRRCNDFNRPKSESKILKSRRQNCRQ